MTEKQKKALAVLETACENVTEAMNVIDKFAKAYGFEVNFEREPDAMTLPELAEAIAKETNRKLECVLTVLQATFGFLQETGATIAMEVKDNDK